MFGGYNIAYLGPRNPLVGGYLIVGGAAAGVSVSIEQKKIALFIG
jgi:hypothetical protein